MIDKNYIYAVSLVIGTSVGAGVFGLPYVASRSGFIIFLILLIVLGFIMMIMSLMYAEITLRTRKKCRLVGYCGKYLGKGGKKIAAIITLFSLYASILAYIIIGGKFLSAIFSGHLGGNDFTYGVIMAILISAGIYVNLRLVSFIEFLMVIFLFVTIFGVIFKGSFFIDAANLLTYDISQSFFPFGAILFSVGALSAIPELEHIIENKKEKIKSAIIVGSITTIIIYAMFTAVILGITGSFSSDEALLGLSLHIGDGIVVMGFIFGVFAIATSFLVIGVNLKEVFLYDYHFDEKKSWALACLIPLIIFILGFRDFIAVINIAGSVMGGMAGMLIITSFYKAKKMGDLKPAFEIKIPKELTFIMVTILVLGVVYQFVYG